MLLDRWRTFPECFKAEKIEPDQSALLRKFGLMSGLLSQTARIRGVVGAEDGRVLGTRQVEQFGIFYHDMVNNIRGALPSTVDFKVGRVQDIEADVNLQRVTLVGGEVHTARLVALACGVGGDLQTRLGMRREMIQKDQSLALGFTIEPATGRSFPFDAVTYYPDGCLGRIGYLTLFRAGSVMRANLFVFWSSAEARTRAFLIEPRQELARIFPKLTDIIGDYDVVSRVESSRIDLYRMAGNLRPGVVLLADAYQGVCPTTGTGLSKVLTDVDVLCHDCLPNWLSTPGMGLEKIADFYANTRKREVDRHSLASASFNRQIAISDTFRWRMQRLRRQWTRRLTSAARGTAFDAAASC